MAEIKVSNLAVTTTLSANDRVVVLTNTNTAAVLKTITSANLKLLSNTVPVANTSNGTPGQVAYNNNHLYVCVANNTWGRASLTLGW
jgi:hypothetical protein